MRILIVEDEKDLNRLLEKRLTFEGYITDCCYDGAEVIEYLETAEYDAVILDLMLPGTDGMQVLRTVRSINNQVPVLILSAKSETKDIVSGLDAGADDYMVKPFDFSELLARLRLITRKKVETRENTYRCDGLEVDTNNKTVRRNGVVIPVSPREYAILLYLIRNQGTVLTRQQIVDNIYNLDQDINSNVIDVYIRLLRKKIDVGFDHKLIHTMRGIGYVLKWTE
ncbi:MAG: response regulator transcription factor [Firmicutes bacterium]|nr:response regulator transcription factor [Bacillota bacterium]